MKQYKVHTKNLTLENYVKYFNEVLYPLNYPYRLKMGLRVEGENMMSIIVQIGIPKVEGEDFDMDKPTEYGFQDILTIYGDSDLDVLEKFESIHFSEDHKEYFKQLWK